MPVIKSRSQWNLETQKTREKKGPLVKVEISPGRHVKMYKSDVEKKPRAPETKIKKDPVENKSLDIGSDEPIDVDDLTSISGIGKATERSLNDHSIYTFDQLYLAGELVFLTDKINQKIEAWRESRS